MRNKSAKAVEEVIACVIDYGTFTALADKLAETMQKVYYYSPAEKEYKSIQDAMMGFGLKRVIKLEDFFDPDVFDTIDLFIFPDIGYGGLQRHLVSLGKAVWGSMGADELELYRDFFIQTLKEVGLPIAKSKTIQGLTALGNYLKNVDNKWIKINCFRDNMETWYHLNYIHSARRLENLAIIFGGAKEQVTFVVQNVIDSDMECGYDGWCINGQYPSKSFQGYEKKNELYLGSLLQDKDLPEEIQFVNERMAPVLEEYGYKNWWATEIRVSKGVPYFIDPTARHPGQSGEHQWETCLNLADVIWQGANDIIIEPKFGWAFAAEATVHYDAMSCNPAVAAEWKTLEIPKNIQRWFKPYHYCIVDGIYQFMPEKNDEVGVIIGVGDSIKEAIDKLKKHLDIFDELPVYANIAGFVDLLESIKEAAKQGIKFADNLPEPGSVL
jgi:hypothetical protein